MLKIKPVADDDMTITVHRGATKLRGVPVSIGENAKSLQGHLPEITQFQITVVSQVKGDRFIQELDSRLSRAPEIMSPTRTY